jgi:hypothetical protein
LVPVGRGGAGESVNMYKKCAHVNVNAKMVPVETIFGMEEGGDKGEQWIGWRQYDIYDIL